MYYLTWCFTRILGVLPISFFEVLARGLAVVSFDILRIRRRLILENIATAFPTLSSDEREGMGRASMYHFAATLLETLLGGPHDMLSGVVYRHQELMDRVISQGKGVYLLCIHSGNFEVLGAAVSTRWKPVTVPVKHVGHGGFDRYVHEQRVRYHIDPIRSHLPREGYKAIRRAIGQGRPVGFMLDQARHGEPRLPLFGRPAKTNTSLASIWRSHPAPLLPLLAKRTAFGCHEIMFFDEVEPICTEDREQDVIQHAIRYNGIVEMMIKVCPEQYWWIHNRWK